MEKKILRYTSFYAMLEAKGAGKTMIFYSEGFRSLLTSIARKSEKGNKVARLLLVAEASNQALDTYTLIDKTEKNDMISYVQASRIEREYTLDPEAMASWKPADGEKFWKQGRTPQYGIGRWARHIITDVHKSELDGTELEAFVNAYKSTYDIMAKGLSGFELVKGEDIRKWYLDSNYEEVSGQLGNSCMRYKKCQPYLDIYVENPEVCQLLVLKGDNPDKIIGRALIWTLSDGNRFMDRIYTIKDSDKIRFENWARENGLFRDFRHTSGIVKVKPGAYDYYPYMDSFEYYIPESGKLSYAHSANALTLKNTDGTGGEQGVWSDYHNEYIDEEDARWCEDVGSYVHYENAVWLEYLDEYVSENADTTYSEWHGGSFYTQDLVYSDCMNDYLYPEYDVVEFKIDSDGNRDWCPKRLTKFYVEVDGEFYSRDKYRKDPYTGEWGFDDEKADGGTRGEALEAKLVEDLGVDRVTDEELQGMLVKMEIGDALTEEFSKVAKNAGYSTNKNPIIPGVYAYFVMNLPPDRIKTRAEIAKSKIIEIANEMGMQDAVDLYSGITGWQSKAATIKIFESSAAFDISKMQDRVYKSILLRQLSKN